MQDLKFLWITIESIEFRIYSYPYPNIDFQISCQQAGLPKTRTPTHTNRQHMTLKFGD